MKEGAFLWPRVNQHLHLIPFLHLLDSVRLCWWLYLTWEKLNLDSETIILSKDWDISDDWNGDLFGTNFGNFVRNILKKEWFSHKFPVCIGKKNSPKISHIWLQHVKSAAVLKMFLLIVFWWAKCSYGWLPFQQHVLMDDYHFRNMFLWMITISAACSYGWLPFWWAKCSYGWLPFQQHHKIIEEKNLQFRIQPKVFGGIFLFFLSVLRISLFWQPGMKCMNKGRV
jgi:hypothetical protein